MNYIDPSGHWGQAKGSKKRNMKMKEKGIKIRFSFIHQDITMEALLFLNLRNKTSAFTSTDLHRATGLSEHETGYILDGSILPDYIGDNIPEGYDWKIEENLKKKTVILNQNITNDVIFHGKNSAKLEKLKKAALKKFKKKKPKKEKLILLGCVLHSIQDYRAHSFMGDLESIKKNFKKGNYVYEPGVLVYNKDWLEYYLSTKNSKVDAESLDNNREEEHREYKDNPFMDFVKSPNIDLWKWNEVNSPSRNGRYVRARNDSVRYLRKALKWIDR